MPAAVAPLQLTQTACRSSKQARSLCFLAVASLERGFGAFQCSNSLSPLAAAERSSRLLDRSPVAGAPGERRGYIRLRDVRVEADRPKDEHHKRCVPEHAAKGANVVPVHSEATSRGFGCARVLSDCSLLRKQAAHLRQNSKRFVASRRTPR